MKQYKGNRKAVDICADMKALEMDIEDAAYEQGGDFITFKGGWCGLPLTIVFNVFNGQFAVYNGFTGKQIATHKSEELDSEEWYSKLCGTFYVPMD